MDQTTLLAVIRILSYGMVAIYLLTNRRWFAWITFTLLTVTTYAYAFSGLTSLQVESLKTIVAGLLIYITVRRK